jgi:PadR family transcriptional regulator, regulatory protein PadR
MDNDRVTLLQGTLDMLILRTLRWGPAHGQAIARFIQSTSGDALLVEHGSLYPALQRLQQQRWITAEWGASDNNRKAKYYRLTPAGRRQLEQQESSWDRLVEAIGRVMRPAASAKP